MKITQHTDDTFVINVTELGGAPIWGLFFFAFLALILFAPYLRDDPVTFGVYLVLSVFAAFFGLMLVMSVRRSQLVLTRRDNGAVLRRRTMFGHKNHRFDLSDIDCFYPSQKYDTQSYVPDSGTALLNMSVTKGMDIGDYSVSTYARSASRVADLCETANRWLQRPAP